MKNVAVIGAGIAGITTAYYLSQKGYSVHVYEQEPYPAMRTSFANGGQISVSNSEVWNTWGNIQRGIKWMFQKDAPLLVRPSLSIDKIKWLIKFVLHTMSGDYARNTGETIKLGVESRNLYYDIIKKEQIEFDFSQCGILHIYKDHDYFRHAVSVKEMYNANKCQWEIVNNSDIQKLDPALASIDGLIGGAWTADDSVGDIHKFCYELSKILKSKYQVKFHFNHPVLDVNELLNNYDAVVCCAGVGSNKIAAQAGDNLSIYPVKGYSITINNVDPKFLPKVSLLDDKAKIVTSTLGNKLRVAGTAELAGENYDIRRDRIEPLLRWVRINFPNINTHDYMSWACLRPMTPNMMPIVKQSPKIKKLYYNTGHGHLGWTLAPATAIRVTSII